MSLHNLNPAELLKLARSQAELIRVRSAQTDAVTRALMASDAERARLGALLILAVRALGGRFEVPEAEQAGIAAATMVNVDEPKPERPTWVVTVLEPLPGGEESRPEEGAGPTLEVVRPS